MTRKRFDLPGTQIFTGDCLDVLRTLPSHSVDAVVTDPPYAISAAGASPPQRDQTSEAACAPDRTNGLPLDSETCSTPHEQPDQVIMNGAMLGMQSQNWDESATHSRGYVDNDPDRFEAWCHLWATECLRVLRPGGHLIAFGGTPTWHRLARGIEEAGFVIRGSMAWLYATGFPKGLNVGAAMTGSKSIGGSSAQQARNEDIASDDDEFAGTRWAGWGTALKPGHEPIVLARKPLHGTVAQNVNTFGTGAINIDGCRIPKASESSPADTQGRWPSDVFLDSSAAENLNHKAAGRPVADFFWHAKPGQGERVTINGVAHPTVKPLALMRELVRLVTPPGGTVLDPFAGSGTTVEACILEKFGCIAIEREPNYVALIQQRIDRQLHPVHAIRARGEDPGLFGLWEDAN